jgi:long-chain acyl-CoA synthetase
MFLAQADRYGDRVLYRFASEGTWQSVTWREARTRTRDIALGLLSLGVGKADRVAVFSPNRFEWCCIDWANICIGALTVPVYSSSTTVQLAHILDHSGATVLVVDSIERLKKLESSGASLGAVRQIFSIEDGGTATFPAPVI